MNSKRIMIVTLVICLLAFTIIFIATNAYDDNSAPTISYKSDTITYKEGEDKKYLLADVVAMDKEEGDVTDSIIIETIQIFPDDKYANVIYAAKDSKNNIAKLSRKVHYVKANMDANEVKSSENSSGEDSQNSNNTKAAENTTTDSSTTDLDTEEPLVSTGVPIIRLNAHEVKISSGEEFNPMNYIEAAVDDKDDIYRRIQINGDYSTTTPGEYTLEYRATDKDGNISNAETLVLIVE